MEALGALAVTLIHILTLTVAVSERVEGVRRRQPAPTETTPGFETQFLCAGWEYRDQ
jgi:hypothetical protein